MRLNTQECALNTGASLEGSTGLTGYYGGITGDSTYNNGIAVKKMSFSYDAYNEKMKRCALNFSSI